MKRLILIFLICFSIDVHGQNEYNDSSSEQVDFLISYYKGQLSVSNNLFYVNFKLGQLYLSKSGYEYGKYIDSSMYYLNKSIKQNKNYALSFYYRGIVREYLGQKAKQILRDYSRAIKLEPTNPNYYVRRANYIYTKTKDAIADYDKAIILSPSDCSIYIRRAKSKSQLYHKVSESEIKLIEDDFEKALQLNCDSLTVLFARAQTRSYYSKNYLGAIHDLTIIINKSNNSNAYYERGSAYYLNNQPNLACDDFKKWKQMGGGGWVWYIKESCGIDYQTWMGEK